MSIDPAIPTVAEILGVELGERPLQHHEMLRYLQRLAAISPRVQLKEYGTSEGGATLLLLTLSTPANLARLSQIEASLRDLDACEDEVQARQLVQALPAVVWLGYGIHGDEPSGPDAALLTAYLLAARTDVACEALLDRSIIHIDPMANPDGRARFLAHAQAFSRRASSHDPSDLIHLGAWPGGRGNHYLFDLNRDAIFGVQAESRARARAVLAANPQVFVDVHEMAPTDTYLFAVPAEPFNPHLPPSVHESWAQFGNDHAAAFDRDGTSYYTRSWNEVFYPGCFDIWPAYHGAVPILYEQAGMVATAVSLPNGRCRTYTAAVSNQVRSTWATLATTTAQKEVVQLRWWHARRMSGTPVMTHRTWLLLSEDTFKVRRVLQLLLAQDIEVERLAHPVEASGLHSIWQAEPLARALPAGTLLIRTTQRRAALVGNIFDWHVGMHNDFLERERRGLELGGKTLLFDVTAWSLPLAFGLESFWSATVPEGVWQRMTASDACIQAQSSIDAASHGYLYIDMGLGATARLLHQGVRIRVATEAFTQSKVRYEAGTLLIRFDDQNEEIMQFLAHEQARGEVQFVAIDSALVDAGPDLGDPAFILLEAPTLALLTGVPMDAANTGALWHLFDVTVGIPLTLLDVTRLAAVDLSRYRVMIVGDVVDRSRFNALLNAGLHSILRAWVVGGGTLIAVRGGAFALAEVGLTSVRPRSQVLSQYPPLLLGRDTDSLRTQDFLAATGSTTLATDSCVESSVVRPVVAPAARTFLPREVETFEFPDEALLAAAPASAELGGALRRFLPRGAYLATHMKPMHWLGIGVAKQLPVIFREEDALIATAGVEVVGRYASPRELALSGLIWPEAVGYLAGTAYLVRERLGAGHVLSFANDPVFRGYSLGTQRLLLNAALLGAAFRGSGASC